MEDNHLKQRIVGAIVLVALAVIFIPMLLSGGDDSDIPMFGTNIPSKPDNVASVRTLELQNTQTPPKSREIIRTPVDEHTPKSNSRSATPAESKNKRVPVDRADESKKPTRRSLPALRQQAKSSSVAAKPVKTIRAWAVQVGSFAKQSNALGQRDRLRKRGYKAFVEKITSKDKTVYRVRVGPEVSKTAAEKLQKKLKRKQKLDGLVVVHP